MGYSYSRTGSLCCDKCGTTGGVRKRTCPHKVTYPQDGPGRSLPYCPAPALCRPCWVELGGTRTLHAQCKEPARRATEENQRIADRIAGGDLQVMSANGSGVPAGMVGVTFAPNRTDRWHEKTYRLIDRDTYRAQHATPGPTFLSDFPNAQPWPEGARA